MNSRSWSLLSIDCEGMGVRRRKAGEWKTHTGSFPSYLPLLSTFSHGLEYQNMPTSLSWLEGRGRYWCRIHRHGTDAGHALSCSYLRQWKSSGCGGRRTVLRRWCYGSKVSLASVLLCPTIATCHGIVPCILSQHISAEKSHRARSSTGEPPDLSS